MVPEMYVKVQLKHYHSSPSKTRGRCHLSQLLSQRSELRRDGAFGSDR